jgi:ADP-ribose pyrophosphatase
MNDNSIDTLIDLPEEKRWRLLDQHLRMDRMPFGKVFDEDVQLPDGRVIKDWLRVELPPFVIVFAQLQDGHVPFVRQYRQGVRGWTIELPSGQMEAGETPLQSAQRELLEEAGIESNDWISLGQYVMEPNRQCGVCHAFLARNAQATRPPNAGDVDEVSVHLFTLEQVQHNFEAGTFLIGSTVLAVGAALLRLKA